MSQKYEDCKTEMSYRSLANKIRRSIELIVLFVQSSPHQQQPHFVVPSRGDGKKIYRLCSMLCSASQNALVLVDLHTTSFFSIVSREYACCLVDCNDDLTRACEL